MSAKVIDSRDRVWNKPEPNLDPEIEPFWEGLRQRKFLLFRCKRCDAYYWPATYCRNHDTVAPFFGDMEWVETSGRGKVHEYNVHQVAFHPGFKEDVPYVYAMIEMEEGPMISSNVIEVDPSKVGIGMSVEVVYEDIRLQDGREFTLPKFRPTEG